MTPTTFDNDRVFLSETDKLVKTNHQACGQFGSSLLSIRSDLKNLTRSGEVLALALEVSADEQSSAEKYTLRLKHHTLSVQVRSHKPTALVKSSVLSPDTALKMNRLIASVHACIGDDYAEDLVAFMQTLFKRNGETCQFTADTEDGEWNLIFQDAKNRTTASVDLFASSEYVPPVVEKVKKAKKPAVAA